MKKLCSFIQGKDQSILVLQRLLQDISAELQDRSDSNSAPQGKAAEVRKAGVCLLLRARLREVLPMIRLSGRSAG